MLRRQSLLGDAMSHAALPGIALAFLLTGSKAPLVLLLGAALAGWLGTLLVMAIVRTHAGQVRQRARAGPVRLLRLRPGAADLHPAARRTPRQAGLDKFLFGQAATLLERDVHDDGRARRRSRCGRCCCFWKEFKLLSFDPDFARQPRLPDAALDVLLTTLIVVAIVIGLQTVGVVLMSAMIVAPAAAARQWTDRLGVMVLLAALLRRAWRASVGAVISSIDGALPTGPTIVLCVSVIVLVSLLLRAEPRAAVALAASGPQPAAAATSTRCWPTCTLLARQHGRLEHGHSDAP